MKILLVEDDVILSAALVKLLEANRYVVDVASDGQAGLELATTIEYDLVLLDVHVPRLSGISLCRQLRSQGYRKPILLLTATDSDAVAVAGFDAGADDYISKPCAPDVLLARMRTWLRRSGALLPSQAAHPPTTTLNWGDLCLDPDAGRVTVGGQVTTLTATEYNLLELFLRHPDRIFSRSTILDRLWSLESAPSDRAIVTHMKDLRKKLKAGGLTTEVIETVYGMGYRLKPAPPAPTVAAGGSENHPDRTQPPHAVDKSAIAPILERSWGSLRAQVAILEQANTALLAGNLGASLRQAARQESHKLAGSLATFGYPEGSALARSIEHLLMADRPFSPASRMRFSELVAALQQTLAQAPATATSLPVTAPQACRVLVVDDDPALTERLTAAVEGWGMHLEFAANPTEARSHLARYTPDVLLLDLSFSAAAEDGLSLLQEITTRSPALPVIVFTGRVHLTDRLAVSRLGARQFLPKPATTAQIFGAIANVFSSPLVSEARVLIVDDDPAALALLSSMLVPWGIEVTTLNHPQHFWDVLVTTSPNLVLLDLEMPQISGLELCQVVRQDAHWQDLPLLVVTAHTDADSLQQAFAAGVDDFIAKPVLGPELVTRVLSRMKRSRFQR